MTASSPRIINEWMKEWWFFWSSQVRWKFQLRQISCVCVWPVLMLSPVDFVAHQPGTRWATARPSAVWRYQKELSLYLQMNQYILQIQYYRSVYIQKLYIIMIFVSKYVHLRLYPLIWIILQGWPVLMMPFHWLVGLVVLLPGGCWVKCFVKMVTFDVHAIYCWWFRNPHHLDV